MAAKALSIQQPWAWAITDLDKRTENRKRTTTYRGEIFLHASAQARDILSLSDICTPEEMDLATEAWEKHQIPLGAIVGVAEIYGCVGCSERGWRPIGHGSITNDRWAEGPLCYLLRNVRKLPKPVPCKGALQIWKVPPKVEAEVRRQLAMPETENVTMEEQRQRVEAAAQANGEGSGPLTPPTASGTTTEPAEAGQATEVNPADEPAMVDGREPAPNSPEDLGYGPTPPEDYSPQQREWFKEAFKELRALDLERQGKKDTIREIKEELDDAKENLKVVDSQIHDLGVRLREIDAGTYVPAQTVEKPPLPGMGASSGDTGTRGPGDTETAEGTEAEAASAAGAGEAKFTDLCTCEHPRLCHEGVNGHGGCQQEGCKCERFALRPPEPAPAADDWKPDEEILDKARQYVRGCLKRGKGISPFSAAKSLFGQATDELQASATRYMVCLEREGLIEPTPYEKKETISPETDEAPKKGKRKAKKKPADQPRWMPVDPKDGE